MLVFISDSNPIDQYEKDLVTGLYPFMSAASGRVGRDMNLIYFLLLVL